MYDIVTALIASLNLIEVRGQQNLALLYNTIDTLKQMQTAFKPKEEAPHAEENPVK
jgi:hypothetical protein